VEGLIRDALQANLATVAESWVQDQSARERLRGRLETPLHFTAYQVGGGRPEVHAMAVSCAMKGSAQRERVYRFWREALRDGPVAFGAWLVSADQLVW
jgi:hypothetical protein